MKLGIYVSGTEARSGGAHTFEKTILNSLNNIEIAHEVCVFSTLDDIHFSNPKIQYVQVRQSKPRNLFQKIKREIRRVLKQLRPNKTSPLQQAIDKHPIDLLWFATEAFEPVEVPYVYTLWDLNHRVNPYFPEVSAQGEWESRDSFYSNILPKATLVITGAQTGKEEIMQFYGVLEDKIKVMPFPTPVLKETPQSQSIDLERDFGIKKPYLFYPSLFWPHKNHIRILEALKILKETHSETMNAVFVGHDTGNRHYIETQIKKMGLEDAVTILDFVAEETLVALYKNAFALAYASFFGPDNLPPLEAFSLKCAVISSNYRGAKEQLGDNALFFNLKDSQSLAEAVIQLKSNPTLKESLIQKAFQQSEQWTPQDYTQAVLRELEPYSKIRRCWGKR
tara:strand:- start:60775 stop:61956 length:1182 start_codon:yes stop_codon:yes gene_type:complete